MSRTRPILLALLLLVTAALPVEAAKPTTDPPRGASVSTAHAPDRVIVQWKQAGKVVAGQRAHGLGRASELHGSHGPMLVGTNGRRVEDVVDELNHDPAVAWAEPDYVMQVDAVSTDDPLGYRQYSLDRMRVRDAWSLEKGGNAVVAVVDTGVQAGHPDLDGRIAPGGYDFVNNDSNPRDDNGHGTWVSGIIAAANDNAVGISGISWTDTVLPVKVMDETGHGYSSDVAKGIDYAVDHGAQIINMSIGGFEYSNTVKAAVDRAWEAGLVLVAAAGNYRTSQPSYPAAYDHVVSVSATQAEDEFTNWSNYGATVDVSAPGAAVTTTNCTRSPCIHSTWGPYIDISGTSFATPNTAGVVALIMARYPDDTNQQVVDRLLDTTDDLGYPGWDDRYGTGRVNALRAVGGTPAQPPRQAGDAWEGNNTVAAAEHLSRGTVHPTNYPAGDVDYFSFTVPRAGRIKFSVSPVVDTTRLAKSSLSFDPVLELWVGGNLVRTIDDPSDSTAVERAGYQAAGRMRVTLGIRNWLPNGTEVPYTLRSWFVDNVAPQVAADSPQGGATGLPADITATAVFDEQVTGVDTSSLRLRDSAGDWIPAEVGYDATSRQAWLRPEAPLAGNQTYRLVARTDITDIAGNALDHTSWSFTTGNVASRIGSGRFSTAAALSREAFGPGVPVAMLANVDSFTGSLAGAPYAARLGGPILFVNATSMPRATAAELDRLNPDRIVVLGGRRQVSSAVRDRAGEYTDGRVTRISSSSRYRTAARMSAGVTAGTQVVYVANGDDYAWALAGSALAARDRAPLLLVQDDRIPSATADELDRLNPDRIVVLGGAGSVNLSVEHALAAYTAGDVARRGGGSRYSTSLSVSRHGYAAGSVETVYLASGTTYADALGGAASVGASGAPMLLVREDRVTDALMAELERLAPSQVVVLGDRNRISDAVLGALGGALG